MEMLNWQMSKNILIDEDADIRKIIAKFALPLSVVKLPTWWNTDMTGTTYDFTFLITIEQTSSFADDCLSTINNYPVYRCEAIPLIRLENGSSITSWNRVHEYLKSGNTNNIERVSQLRQTTKDECHSLTNSLYDLYVNTLSIRMNDINGKVS